MEISGAQILMEILAEQGVDIVFGYPGGQVLNIYDALYDNSDRIKHIITAHEQGAVHAADGYARASGKVGVVIATSGPGATNLVTGIANAYLDSTPLVAITGNVPCSLIGRDSFQEVDITGVTMPITKHNFMVKDVDRLAEVLREAFKIAISGRPGPVLVDIPKDVQTATCEFEPMPAVVRDEYRAVSDEELDRAAELIKKAKKPYIFCGGGVGLSGAEQEISALSELIDAPVGCTLMGLSSVSHDNKRNLGLVGMHGIFAASRSKAAADLIIAAGVRFSDRATGNKTKYANGTTVIHIDIDPAEIDKNIAADMGIVGNIKDVLAGLLTRLDKTEHPDWWREIDGYRRTVTEKEGVLTPKRLVEAVAEFTNDDTPIATDVGQHQMWAAQYYPLRKPRTLITSGGLGTMGFGMGAAIGAAVATGKKTVLFTGDGSFGMNLNEMATAVSLGAPLVIILMNNGVLGMVRQWQTLFFNRHYSSTNLCRATDFVKLSEAFGAKGYRVTELSQLKPVLEQAFSQDGPVLVDCLIDKDEFVLPMMPPGGSYDDIITKVGESD